MFNAGLYYPTIDIQNDGWLKSAILIWDRIETIVPESNNNPYRRRTTRVLSEEGLLLPHRVNPFNWEVAGLADDVYRYLRTEEGRRSIRRPDRRISRKDTMKYSDALEDNKVGERLIKEYDSFYIHSLKLPYSMQNWLNEYTTDDGYIKVDANFMKFYMTLLANRICQINNLALLTDRTMMNDLSKRVMADGLMWQEDGSVTEDERIRTMYEVVVENICINPDTPVERIVRFKRNREDELNRFREVMDELTCFDMTGMTYEDVRHRIETIYLGEVVPATKGLKEAIRDARINWRDCVLECSLTGFFPELFNNPSVKRLIPMVVGSGIVIAMKAKRCCKKRKEIETGSPYAYLLKMDNRFHGVLRHGDR